MWPQMHFWICNNWTTGLTADSAEQKNLNVISKANHTKALWCSGLFFTEWFCFFFFHLCSKWTASNSSLKHSYVATLYMYMYMHTYTDTLPASLWSVFCFPSPVSVFPVAVSARLQSSSYLAFQSFALIQNWGPYSSPLSWTAHSYASRDLSSILHSFV